MTTSRGRSVEFATSCFASGRWANGDYLLEPASVIHAKRMGGTTTICGLSALTWFKFWGQPFESVTGQKCPSCVDLLDSE